MLINHRSVIPPSLCGPTLIDDFGLPRYWAAVWASLLPADPAPSTVGKKLGHLECFYKHADERLGQHPRRCTCLIEYLSTEADGFHSTPYGHCINSFMVDPCPKRLECFNGCKHLSATDLSQTRHNLVQLEARFEVTVQSIEARRSHILGGASPAQLDTQSIPDEGPSGLQAAVQPLAIRASGGIGLENQLSHAKTRLAAVRKLLATPPGELVFPNGLDLSYGPTKARGMVLDDVQ